MDPNNPFRQVPHPFHPPTNVNGYYYPIQAQYNMAQVQPQPSMGTQGIGMGQGMRRSGPEYGWLWHPQGTFAPTVQPFTYQQWSYLDPRQGRGPAGAIGQRLGAGDEEVRRTNELDAHIVDVLADALKRGKDEGLSQRDVLERLQHVRPPPLATGAGWITDPMAYRAEQGTQRHWLVSPMHQGARIWLLIALQTGWRTS